MGALAKLKSRYTGDRATLYDTSRVGSLRWDREAEIITSLMENLSYSSVIDAPVGTGRWFKQLSPKARVVYGNDISSDMLMQATKKFHQTIRSDSITWVPLNRSIFQLDRSLVTTAPELAICIRFLNWLPLERAISALRVLAALGPKYMIIGCNVLPLHTSFSLRLSSRSRLALANLRSLMKSRQYVHSEELFLDYIQNDLGHIVEKHFVFRNSTRVNYIYLIEVRPEESLGEDGARIL